MHGASPLYQVLSLNKCFPFLGWGKTGDSSQKSQQVKGQGIPVFTYTAISTLPLVYCVVFIYLLMYVVWNISACVGGRTHSSLGGRSLWTCPLHEAPLPTPCFLLEPGLLWEAGAGDQPDGSVKGLNKRQTHRHTDGPGEITAFWKLRVLFMESQRVIAYG